MHGRSDRTRTGRNVKRVDHAETVIKQVFWVHHNNAHVRKTTSDVERQSGERLRACSHNIMCVRTEIFPELKWGLDLLLRENT